MALLKKLKSILGLGGSDRDPNQRRDVGVTVEQDPGEPNRADSAGAGAGTDRQAPDSETPAGAGSDHGTASEGHAGEAADSEPTGSEAADAGSEAADAGSEAAGSATEAADTEGSDDGDDLEEIKGVGPAYAQRLRDAGVGSVADLAGADAEDLAAATDLSANRIGNWIEQAEDR